MAESNAASIIAKLREPFPKEEVGLLPRNVRKDDREKYQCRQGTKASADGKYCGGYHAQSIHLDYVGHAAITNRLLQVDPEWSWEPLALTPEGLPRYDQFGGLWIKLKVGGLERLGYGDANGKPAGPQAVKEIIGDALRNAGMRFGMALDLWSKENLAEFAVEQSPSGPEQAPGQPQPTPRVQTPTQAPREPEKPVEMITEEQEEWLLARIRQFDSEEVHDAYLERWQSAGLPVLGNLTREQFRTACELLPGAKPSSHVGA